MRYLGQFNYIYDGEGLHGFSEKGKLMGVIKLTDKERNTGLYAPCNAWVENYLIESKVLLINES